jgi:hypothetical protein
MRSVLSAAIVSLLAITAALALPVSPTAKPELTSSDLIQVGKKYYKGGKHYKHYNKRYYKGGGRYYHGGRYWGRRYYSRPYNWQALGCIVVGPVWYCP